MLAAVFKQSSSARNADEHYLWPCNAPLWLLWQDLQTQWRVGGMGTPTGLDYASVRAYLDDTEPPPDCTRAQVWAALRACERATLDAWAKNNK